MRQREALRLAKKCGQRKKGMGLESPWEGARRGLGRKRDKKEQNRIDGGPSCSNLSIRHRKRAAEVERLMSV
jgi:hypothetical protein